MEITDRSLTPLPDLPALERPAPTDSVAPVAEVTPAEPPVPEVPEGAPPEAHFHAEAHRVLSDLRGAESFQPPEPDLEPVPEPAPPQEDAPAGSEETLRAELVALVRERETDQMREAAERVAERATRSRTPDDSSEAPELPDVEPVLEPIPEPAPPQFDDEPTVSEDALRADLVALVREREASQMREAAERIAERATRSRTPDDSSEAPELPDVEPVLEPIPEPAPPQFDDEPTGSEETLRADLVDLLREREADPLATPHDSDWRERLQGISAGLQSRLEESLARLSPDSLGGVSDRVGRLRERMADPVEPPAEPAAPPVDPLTLELGPDGTPVELTLEPAELDPAVDPQPAVVPALRELGLTDDEIVGFLEGDPEEQGARLTQALLDRGLSEDEVSQFFDRVQARQQEQALEAARVAEELAQGALVLANVSERLRGAGFSPEEIAQILDPEGDGDQQQALLLEGLRQRGLEGEELERFLASLPASPVVDQQVAALTAAGLSEEQLRQLAEAPSAERESMLLAMLTERGATPEQIRELGLQLLTPEERRDVLVSQAVGERLLASGFTPEELETLFALPPEEQADRLLALLEEKGISPERAAEIFRPAVQPEPDDLDRLLGSLREAGLSDEELRAIFSDPERQGEALVQALLDKGLDQDEIGRIMDLVNPAPDPAGQPAREFLSHLLEAGVSPADLLALRELPAEQQGERLAQLLAERGLGEDAVAELMLRAFPAPPPPPALSPEQAAWLDELTERGVTPSELQEVLGRPEEERAAALEALLRSKGLEDAEVSRLLGTPPVDPAQLERAQSFVDALKERGLSPEEIAGFLDGQDLEGLTGRLREAGMSQGEIDRLMFKLTPSGEPPLGYLDEEEARLIGTGLQGRPPQTFWVERSVGTIIERATEQGLLSGETRATNQALAERLFSQAQDPSQPGGEFPPSVLAALAKEAGLSLDRLDPNQVVGAARYVAQGGTLAEQRDRLAQALDNLAVLQGSGLPRLELNDVKGILWDMARVGGHSLDNLRNDPAALQKAFEDVASGFNAGPGQYEIKVGRHDVRFGVAETGYVEGSGSTQGPGFWGTVGPILRTGLTFAAVGTSLLVPGALGGTLALVLKGASAAVGAVDAVRSGNVLGAIGAIASAAGVGLGSLARVAGTASSALQHGVDVANYVAQGTHAINSIQSGSLVGLAGGVLGLAGTASHGLLNNFQLGSGVTTALHQVGQVSDLASSKLMYAGAVEQFVQTSLAVNAARSALEAAQQLNDPAAVAEAERRLAEAQGQRTSALLGGLSLALDVAGSRTGQEGLGLAAQGTRVAAAAVAGNWAGVGAGVLGVAAGLDPHAQLGRFDLQQYSQLADAGSNFAQALLAERDAKAGVAQAQEALLEARRLGDPAAVEAAERALGDARRARDSAALDAFFGGQNLIGTGQQVAADTEAREALRRQVMPDFEAASRVVGALGQLEGNPRVSGALKDMVDLAQAGVREAGDNLALALRSGDPEEIQRAQQGFAQATLQAENRARLISTALLPPELLASPITNRLDLPPLPDIPVVTSSIRFDSGGGLVPHVTSTVRFPAAAPGVPSTVPGSPSTVPGLPSPAGTQPPPVPGPGSAVDRLMQAQPYSDLMKSLAGLAETLGSEGGGLSTVGGLSSRLMSGVSSGMDLVQQIDNIQNGRPHDPHKLIKALADLTDQAKGSVEFFRNYGTVIEAEAQAAAKGAAVLKGAKGLPFLPVVGLAMGATDVAIGLGSGDGRRVASGAVDVLASGLQLTPLAPVGFGLGLVKFAVDVGWDHPAFVNWRTQTIQLSQQVWQRVQPSKP